MKKHSISDINNNNNNNNNNINKFNLLDSKYFKIKNKIVCPLQHFVKMVYAVVHYGNNIVAP